MATEEEDAERDRKVYSTFIRMSFTPYAIHFKSPNFMREETLDRIDVRIVKETLRLTGTKAYVRNAIGHDFQFWEEISAVFRAAVTSLERRSFQQWDPTAVDYETTSSTLIASAYKGLTKDLERLNDLVAIVRNILTAGGKVQDLCVDSHFDTHMLNLLNCCVRVTARGYDGEPNTGDEEKWQMVVNAYKKLLITSLQFLNNHCARNESNKLALWMALFDNGEQFSSDLETDRVYVEKIRDELDRKRYIAAAERVADSTHTEQSETTGDKGATSDANDEEKSTNDASTVEEDGLNAYALFWRHKTDHLRPETTTDAEIESLHAKTYDEWVNLKPDEMAPWKARWADIDFDLERRSSVRALASRQLGLDPSEPIITRIGNIERQLYVDLRRVHGNRLLTKDRKNDESSHYMRLHIDPDEANTVRCTAADAARILEDSKESQQKQLLARSSSHQVSEDDSQRAAVADETPLEQDNDEEDDYHGAAEDGRGLLTDVPLILGPSEIEILPNLIMSGLSPRPPLPPTREGCERLLNMHFLRCHLLLAQENGQNLLRELLIFVAAWDLREEELYFKFMVNIMESLLINGLIPYAYHTFRDFSKSRAKDIISPAQAVIMKLLTNIFRKNLEGYKASYLEHGVPIVFTPVEVHVVNYLFSEFRRRIVPNTCTLIHFQGKIRNCVVPPEDFPLNLWDMERMYEGVYQYLEFFAVLTEEQAWKDIMAKWEVANELVTILKELEAAIPKLPAPGARATLPLKHKPKQKGKEAAGADPLSTVHGDIPKLEIEAQHVPAVSDAEDGQAQAQAPNDGKIEAFTEEYRQDQLKKMAKIKEMLADMRSKRLPPEQKQSADALANELSKLEVDTLASPESTAAPDAQLPYPEEAQDEPADFEWRNLKKLTVLVLSSLIWKNKTVQNQVREFGGLEALVGCCRHDEYNPYIREHAIMCLRFAVEGNDENAAVIRKMSTGPDAVQQVGFETLPLVPPEVLDTQAYETFMDGKGQVGLRRRDIPAIEPALTESSSNAAAKANEKILKEAAAKAIQNAIAGTTGLAHKMGNGKISTKVAAEKAAVLMQNVLQDLPLPDGLNKDGRDIIDRLNRAALESAEFIEGERRRAAAKR